MDDQNRLIEARRQARLKRQRRAARLRLIAPISGILAVVASIGLIAYSMPQLRAAFSHTAGGARQSALDSVFINPRPGSVAYKLKHDQQVNILLVGYGGAENDAPYLTDSIMAITLDPAGHRIRTLSIPRDLWVKIDAWPDGGGSYYGKINEAFDVGMRDQENQGKLPQYTGQNGGGNLAMHVVGNVTGITFDRYVGVDFLAFRQAVDTLGGIDVSLDTPLDDCHYPDYHDGYLNGGVPDYLPCPNRAAGIHFPAGAQHLNGEQALELARSRKASEPEQASDFGRSRRQQMIIAAIQKKALSVNGILKAPKLLNDLQKDYRTDMDVNDVAAVYAWSRSVPEANWIRLSVSDENFLDAYVYRAGSCGPTYLYVLCPQDSSFNSIRNYVRSSLPPPSMNSESAPLVVANATISLNDLGDRLHSSFMPFAADARHPTGIKLADPVRVRSQPKTTIFDYSGGRYPQTSAWLSAYFQADVTVVPPGGAGGPPLPAGAAPDSIVVYVGSDFGKRWIGLAA